MRKHKNTFWKKQRKCLGSQLRLLYSLSLHFPSQHCRDRAKPQSKDDVYGRPETSSRPGFDTNIQRMGNGRTFQWTWPGNSTYTYGFCVFPIKISLPKGIFAYSKSNFHPWIFSTTPGWQKLQTWKIEPVQKSAHFATRKFLRRSHVPCLLLGPYQSKPSTRHLHCFGLNTNMKGAFYLPHHTCWKWQKTRISNQHFSNNETNAAKQRALQADWA